MDVPENPQGPINLGNPGEFTITELARMVLAAIETQSHIVHLPLPADDPRRRQPDIARAREHLGWEPVVPLSDGLQPTIDWFEDALRAGSGLAPVVAVDPSQPDAGSCRHPYSARQA